MNTNIFELFQVIDSSFPIGGYTQSFGLETYVERGIVLDVSSLYNYCRSNLLYNLLYSDILAICEVYRDSHAKNITELDNLLTVSKAPMETRNGSIKLGVRFIKTVTDYKKCQPLLEYESLIKTGECSGHHAVAYGVFCKSIDIPLEEAAKLYMFNQTMSSVTNATKLVPLSQKDGQKVLSKIHGVIDDVFKRAQILSKQDIGTNFPAFDIRGMEHEKLYSRLYMS